MIEIAKYVKAESLEEAYQLNQKKSSTVIGGMLWLKMQKKRVGTAIDLSGLGLDTIEETEEEYRIGAMVSLRQIEQHAGLNALTCGAAKDAVKHIVGVQFRNLATVGGSLFGRYGFSDVLTFFMAIGAKVELYHRGILTVEEFSRLPYDRDILVRVLVPKKAQKTVYLSQRNTKTDFPVLTCCICREEEELRCVIGARPGRAVCLRDEKQILKDGITPESAASFGAYAREQITTGSNLRAGSEYRSILIGVLGKRALLSIASMDGEG
ncbi:MAG: FAD binding domain-containing protein [Fusicatenibacter sp.]|nr:FAD binding domain-containing protein [Fusicatenibacter sp.]